MSEQKLVDVAVGVVMRADGTVLLGQRLSGKAYYGWWEFPGGKFEAGEDAAQALARELDEEIGIQVRQSLPWVVREHVYGHAHVRLHFRRVIRWQGEPHSAEGQALAWRPSHAVDVAPLLPASLAPIQWLGLPSSYLISDAAGLGVEPWLRRLDAWVAAQPGGCSDSFSFSPSLTPLATDATAPSLCTAATAASSRSAADASPAACLPARPGMLLLREPALSAEDFAALFEAVLARLQGTGIRLLVSSRHPLACARRAAECTGGGLHLTGDDLRAVAKAQAGRMVWPPSSRAAGAEHPSATQASAGSPVHGAADEGGVPAWRAAYRLVAASCHRAEDLALAGRVGADFVVCGPVLPTQSHPEAAGCGWEDFGRMIGSTPVPVYALGGMHPSDLDRALLCGAQGVALQRAAWA